MLSRLNKRINFEFSLLVLTALMAVIALGTFSYAFVLDRKVDRVLAESLEPQEQTPEEEEEQSKEPGDQDKAVEDPAPTPPAEGDAPTSETLDEVGETSPTLTEESDAGSTPTVTEADSATSPSASISAATDDETSTSSETAATDEGTTLTVADAATTESIETAAAEPPPDQAKGPKEEEKKEEKKEEEKKDPEEMPAEFKALVQAKNLFGAEPKAPLDLQGILGDTVCISGRWIKVGEQQGDIKVLEIMGDKVRIEKDGNEQELSMWQTLPGLPSGGPTPPGGPKPPGGPPSPPAMGPGTPPPGTAPGGPPPGAAPATRVIISQ